MPRLQLVGARPHPLAGRLAAALLDLPSLAGLGATLVRDWLRTLARHIRAGDLRDPEWCEMLVCCLVYWAVWSWRSGVTR
jgi:hypothetical protein